MFYDSKQNSVVILPAIVKVLQMWEVEYSRQIHSGQIILIHQNDRKSNITF